MTSMLSKYQTVVDQLHEIAARDAASLNLVFLEMMSTWAAAHLEARTAKVVQDAIARELVSLGVDVVADDGPSGTVH